MANLAALRAAVFSLSANNLTEGLKSTPPPVRRLTHARYECDPLAWLEDGIADSHLLDLALTTFYLHYV